MKLENGEGYPFPLIAENISPFFKVTDMSQIIPILEKRLPQSSFIYNAVKMYGRYPERTLVYALGENDSPHKIHNDSWIVLTHFSENYGQNILISAKEKETNITPKQAIKIFSESNLIQWDKAHWFIGVEKWISKIMVEISVDLKGNAIEIHPDVHFYMDPETTRDFDFSCEDPLVQVKRLDTIQGTEFFSDTWKYARDGTRNVAKRFIENNESGGVYLDNKLVSGVINHGYGLLAMLHTKFEHRKKGYAKFCMQFVCKELAKNGMVPSSSTEIWNKASHASHLSLGFKPVGEYDWIFFIPPEP